jgi:hypothetical protein
MLARSAVVRILVVIQDVLLVDVFFVFEVLIHGCGFGDTLTAGVS